MINEMTKIHFLLNRLPSYQPPKVKSFNHLGKNTGRALW